MSGTQQFSHKSGVCQKALAYTSAVTEIKDSTHLKKGTTEGMEVTDMHSTLTFEPPSAGFNTSSLAINSFYMHNQTYKASMKVMYMYM